MRAAKTPEVFNEEKIYQYWRGGETREVRFGGRNCGVTMVSEMNLPLRMNNLTEAVENMEGLHV